MSSFSSDIDQLPLVGLVAGRRTIGGQEFDAFIEEQHTMTAQVTRDPVEDGADVSDHVIQDPDGLRIEGQISNHPPDVDENNPQPFRAESAFSKLREMKEAGQPIVVLTSIRIYENMVIESIDLPRNARLGNVVRVTVQMVNIKTVRSKTVDLPVTEVHRAKPKVDKGTQPAKEATEQQRKSFAAKIGDNWSQIKETLFGGG